jgi:hypothetical protein
VPLVGEQHHAAVDRAVREQPELERGHHAEVAAAAADRPEQVGVLLGGGTDELAPGCDELDRGDVVGREPVLAGEPRQAAADGVAHDADVRRGARQREQAVRRGRLGHLDPQRPGRDARDLRLDVDLDAAHALRGDQDRVLERRQGDAVVARALRGDLQAGAAGVGDDVDDVGGVDGEGDERGALVGQEGPGAAGEVVLGVAGQDDVAGERGGEGARVALDGLRVEHVGSPWGRWCVGCAGEASARPRATHRGIP